MSEPNEQVRELDVDVAKKIFGWKHIRLKHGAKFFFSPESLPDIEAISTFEIVSDGGEDNAPHFSSDFTKAIEVRDFIARQVFSVRRRFNEAVLSIISTRVGTPLHASEVLLKVTAEDICRAAIIAMEEHD